MGARFREADEYNPDGYYEDLDWRDLNKAIFAETEGTWYQPPSATAILGVSDLLRKEIETLTRRKQAESNGKLWGIKDPRLCLTIPLLSQYLPSPLYFSISREKDDVVLSLMRRAKARGYYEESDHWLALVSEYARRKAAFLKGMRSPVYLLSYEHLVRDTWCNVIGIANMIGQTNRDIIRYAAELVRT